MIQVEIEVRGDTYVIVLAARSTPLCWAVYIYIHIHMHIYIHIYIYMYKCTLYVHDTGGNRGAWRHLSREPAA